MDPTLAVILMTQVRMHQVRSVSLPALPGFANARALTLAEHLMGAGDFIQEKAIARREAIATECGVTPQDVRAWETGAQMPTPEQAVKWLPTLYETAPQKAAVA